MAARTPPATHPHTCTHSQEGLAGDSAAAGPRQAKAPSTAQAGLECAERTQWGCRGWQQGVTQTEATRRGRVAPKMGGQGPRDRGPLRAWLPDSEWQVIPHEYRGGEISCGPFRRGKPAPPLQISKLTLPHAHTALPRPPDFAGGKFSPPSVETKIYQETIPAPGAHPV